MHFRVVHRAEQRVMRDNKQLLRERADHITVATREEEKWDQNARANHPQKYSGRK